MAELGIRRHPPGSINPRIVEYNNQTNLVGYDDKISWCSSFVNWCMTHAGIRGTDRRWRVRGSNGEAA